MEISPRIAICLAIFSLVAIAGLDFAAGTELRLASLYLIPVVLVTWSVGRVWGYSFTMLALVILLTFEYTMGAFAGRHLYFYIEALGRFVSFFLFVAMASKLRDAYSREKAYARTDSLTNLMNRRGFYACLDAELARRDRSWEPFALLYLDCDNFKKINDAFGHHEGDRLLFLISSILKKNVRRGDLVARLGGDEFAIFFPNDNQDGYALTAAAINENLLHEIHPKYPLVSFSIGIAIFADMPPTLDEVIMQADRLMYRVKQSGKNGLLQETF